jgi:23S rRNA (cytosine1962-C5)-methyltransferase
MSLGNYKLIDFGESEKLESFGGTIVRRETPAAIGLRDNVDLWSCPQLRGKQAGTGYRWIGETPSPWYLDTGSFRLQLKPTPTGQLGVFPEQAENWDWIAHCPLELKDLRALNLFAYTGGTTLALANRGVQVTHVDAAKSVVNWARANSQDSGLNESPIRWIVEDAMTFVQREIKRGNEYDIVVADPPSFGRGPKKELWKIQHDLEDLVDSLSQLASERFKMILLSCHTPGIDHDTLAALVNNAFNFRSGDVENFELSLSTDNGKQLPSGDCVRWLHSQ